MGGGKRIGGKGLRSKRLAYEDGVLKVGLKRKSKRERGGGGMTTYRFGRSSEGWKRKGAYTVCRGKEKAPMLSSGSCMLGSVNY